MKRIFSCFLAALQILLICFMLSGCKGKESTIYFLNFKPESAAAYKKVADAYEDETGIKVKIVTAAANTYEQTLKSEVAKNDPPTIFQVNGPIGFNAWSEYCLDITDSGLVSLLSDESLAIHSGGRIYAVPYVVEAYGIIYNDEIMQKYFAMPNRASNLTSAAEINSFEELKTVAEDMTKHKEQLGIEGVFASTSLISGEDWRWQTHLANIPLFHELRNSGEDPVVSVTNAKTVDFSYAENFRNLFDLYTQNSVTEKTLLGSKSVEDSMAEFALGKCAMVQNGTWAWSQIDGVMGNTVKSENIKMLPIYTGISGEENTGLCIGTENYFAINSKVSAEKQQASLDFLYWLFSSETGKKLVKEELKFTTPFNTFGEDELPEDPLAKEVVRYMNDTSKENIPWIFTGFPSENFKTAFGDALLEYVQGSKTFEEVVEIVKNKWQSER